MNVDDIKIRRLSSTDSILYRDIRLEALRCSPEAFGSTFEAENVQSLNWFSDRLVRAEVSLARSGIQNYWALLDSLSNKA